jgi:hypothetical protein
MSFGYHENRTVSARTCSDSAGIGQPRGRVCCRVSVLTALDAATRSRISRLKSLGSTGSCAAMVTNFHQHTWPAGRGRGPYGVLRDLRAITRLLEQPKSSLTR